MITETDAEGLLRYLIGLRAVTAVQDQPASWRAYLNHAVPHLAAMDLLPAANLAVDAWAGASRSWQIDAARYVAAVKALWGQRRRDYRALHAGAPGHSETGEPLPEVAMTGDEYVAWLQTAAAAIREGVDDAEEVLARAYFAVGRDVPRAEIAAPNTQREK